MARIRQVIDMRRIPIYAVAHAMRLSIVATQEVLAGLFCDRDVEDLKRWLDELDQ